MPVVGRGHAAYYATATEEAQNWAAVICDAAGKG